MFTSLSSNVVLAKARTMYGRRLSPANYNELLKCRSVGEVAGYLKSHTVYGKSLAGIAENEVHRGQLESRLKQKLMDDYASLCKYEVTVDKNFSQYFIQRDEIECILHAVLLINAGVFDHKYPVPPYLLHHSQFNFKAFEEIRDFDGLMQNVKNSPFEKILEPFKPKKGQRLDYTGIENALYFFLYSNILKIIHRHFSGGAKKELLNIFNSYVDLNNYVRIARLKMSYGADSGTIWKSLLPLGVFGKEDLNQMIQAKDENELRAALERTKTGRDALKTVSEYPDELPAKHNFFMCRHYMDYSTYPSVVLISYIFLCQTEINNIITIVEGIRYQLAPPEIRKLLVPADNRHRNDAVPISQGKE